MWAFLGSLTPGLGQVLIAISGAKWFYSIIRNWGAIRQVVQSMESVAQGMLSRESPVPTCDETKKLLDCARILFDRELIDLPGIEEKDVARILGNIENNLICEIEKRGV